MSSSFWSVTQSLMGASLYTLGLFVITLIFAIPLGLGVCVLARSKFKPLRAVMRVIIWIIRGTPLMLQIVLFVYAPGLLFGISVSDRFIWVALAFVINYAAYFAEIYRGGIESIPVGQYEAGKVLGFSKKQTFSKIIMPQLVKRIVPPMGNEVITLNKDTSLANVVGIAEIIITAKDITNTTGAIWPIFYTGVFYLIFSGIMTLVLQWIEKKLNYYR